MFNRHYADPIDAQHTILLRLLGGASFVGAGAAAAIASGSWGRDSGSSAGGAGRAAGAQLQCLQHSGSLLKLGGRSRGGSQLPGKQDEPRCTQAHLCLAHQAWHTGARCPALPRPADLAKLALLGQGLANALTFAYYSASLRWLNLPAEVVVNGACALLPALDLLSTGRHRVRCHAARVPSLAGTHVQARHADKGQPAGLGWPLCCRWHLGGVTRCMAAHSCRCGRRCTLPARRPSPAPGTAGRAGPPPGTAARPLFPAGCGPLPAGPALPAVRGGALLRTARQLLLLCRRHAGPCAALAVLL